ncbi:MAG: glycosyltransferase family 2 protein [Cyanobacteria bacterium P01_H01_bin.15]
MSQLINVQKLNLATVLVIVPVQNEAETIAGVIANLKIQGLQKICIVDNGSTDETAKRAITAGADVVYEPKAGYGQACWRGIQHLPPEIEWVLFCDGDGSDHLDDLPRFWTNRTHADLILGNRTATAAGSAVLTPAQRFGNRLACTLIWAGWGHRFRDLGPLRLIRREALNELKLRDRGFGWTVEMQVRALDAGLEITEIPVSYRPRQAGQSKISGTLRGSYLAGKAILGTLAHCYAQRLGLSSPRSPSSTNGPGWLAGILLLLGSVMMLPYGDFVLGPVSPGFWLGAGTMSLGFLVGFHAQVSRSWFWFVAIATRISLLPMAPGNDIWRYLWEGLIQRQGFNPYALAPDATELVFLRPEWWTSINHPTEAAVYGPLAELGFQGLAAIDPAVWLFKLAFIAADLTICWLLVRQYGHLRSRLYAWSPLVIYVFAGGGHFDSWFILPLVASVVLFDRGTPTTVSEQLPWGGWLLSAFLVGGSIAIKWVSIPLLGFLGWRAYRESGWRWSALILMTGLGPLLLSAWSYCATESCLIDRLDSGFIQYGRSAELLPYVLRQLTPNWFATNPSFLVPFVLICLGLIVRSPNFTQFCRHYFFALLVFLPNVHGWYFAWLLPFAVSTQNLGARLISVSAFWYFVLPYREGILGETSWQLSLIERAALWLPLVALWGVCPKRLILTDTVHEPTDRQNRISQT